MYVGGVWALSLLVSAAPQLLIGHMSTLRKGHCQVRVIVHSQTHLHSQVSQNIAYQVYATMCAFYVPSIVIIVVNYQIYRSARRLQKEERRRQLGICQMYAGLPRPTSCNNNGTVINGAIAG